MERDSNVINYYLKATLFLNKKINKNKNITCNVESNVYIYINLKKKKEKQHNFIQFIYPSRNEDKVK